MAKKTNEVIIKKPYLMDFAILKLESIKRMLPTPECLINELITFCKILKNV